MPKKKERFQSLELRVAKGECGRKDDFVFDQCAPCGQRVMLHCVDCKIQVSGCLCTEYERFGNDEGWKRAVDRFGEDLAREKARSAGLWVPEQRNLR